MIDSAVVDSFSSLAKGDLKWIIVKPETVASDTSRLIIDCVGERGATHADLIGKLDQTLDESRTIIYKIEYSTNTPFGVAVEKFKIVIINWVPQVLLDKAGNEYTRRKMFAPKFLSLLKGSFGIEHIVDGINNHEEMSLLRLIEKAGRFERDPILPESVH